MSVKSNTLLSAWGAFFVAHALSTQRIEKTLSEKAPLSMAEYDALLTIERAPEKRMRYSEIASASVYTKSGITRILKRLEERGCIERLKCPSDGRGAFAALTPVGASALKDTWKIYSEEILAIFEPALTQSQAKELESIMSSLIDEVRGVSLVQLGSSCRPH